MLVMDTHVRYHKINLYRDLFYIFIFIYIYEYQIGLVSHVRNVPVLGVTSA